MSGISESLARIKRVVPYRSRYGQLYKRAEEKSKKFRKVILYSIFVSHKNDYLLRPHEFASNHFRGAKQWHDFFERNLTDIYNNAILPGIALRTGKHWSVYRIIGWSGNVSAPSSNAATARKRGHPTTKRKEYA